jgi:asparagine synthase (glutamine-hydrolysing)
MDQPTADGINTWFVARLARRNNIQVLLSGVGGDELLGGYRTYTVVPLILKLRKIFNINLNLCKSILNFLIKIADMYGLRRYERIFLRLQLILSLKPSIINAYIVKRLVFTPYEIARILKIPEINVLTLLTNYLNKLNCFNKNGYIQEEKFDLFYLETIHYLRNQLLRDADWAGMAHSVEIRTPFCDTFLRADVCNQFLHDKSRKKLKYILSRDYFKLPKEIYKRKKTGFITQIPYNIIDRMLDCLPQKKNRYWFGLTEYQKLTISICLKKD